MIINAVTKMRILKSVLFSLLFFQSINTWALEEGEKVVPINQLKLENSSFNISDGQSSEITQNVAFVLNNWTSISTLAVIPACSADELDLAGDENLFNEVNRQKKLWVDLLTRSTFTEEKLLRTIEAVKSLLITPCQ